jgi:dihydroorotase
MRQLIRNATIINEGKRFIGSVLVEGDRIAEIVPGDLLAAADVVVDAKGKLLLPGVIDDQVHFREPGLTHKGSIESESKAAVAGGITSFMEMPNTNPQTTTIELLEAKYRRAAEVSPANYSFYIGATNGNIDEVLKADPRKICGIKCFMGSSTGNMLVEGEGLETLFRNAHMLVATHNEEETIIQSNIALFRDRYGEEVPVSAHPLIRSAEACYASSAKAIDMASKFNTRLHILHLSTARELDLFAAGDVNQKRITNEVCVHHLWFDELDYERFGNRIKWNPAIKTLPDKIALRSAVNSGKIDIVATDHAPHTLEEKANSYFKSPSGGPLVQHSLVAMLEMAVQGVIYI